MIEESRFGDFLVKGLFAQLQCGLNGTKLSHLFLNYCRKIGILFEDNGYLFFQFSVHNMSFL